MTGMYPPNIVRLIVSRTRGIVAAISDWRRSGEPGPGVSTARQPVAQDAAVPERPVDHPGQLPSDADGPAEQAKNVHLAIEDLARLGLGVIDGLAVAHDHISTRRGEGMRAKFDLFGFTKDNKKPVIVGPPR